MFKFIKLGLLTAASVLMLGGVAEARKATKKKRITTVLLKDSNSISIKTPFRPALTATVKQQLIAMSHSLPKTATIYLYLDTPGGSVIDGIKLIQIARDVPQKVTTITHFAGSMGFITVQRLGPRYITPRGILMSHRASGGVSGQIPGEIDTRLTFWHDYLRSLDRSVARRLGISLNDYRKLNFNEYWISGWAAVRGGAADKVVKVRCHKSLSGTYDQQLRTFFGPVQVTWSKCPLLSVPIKINFDAISYGDEEQVRSVIYQLLYEKHTVTDAILKSEKFRKVLP